jgi:hypothetical protein
LVGEDLVVPNSTFEEVAAVMDGDDEDEDIDFCIGLKFEG